MNYTVVDQSHLRILISGHLPPPTGGMATYYLSLLNSILAQQVDLHFVQTSSQKRDFSKSGRVSLPNFISALQDCSRFTLAFLRYHPQIAHIATAEGLSFLKHCYCICLARLLGSKVLLHPHCSLAVLYLERSRWWRWFFRSIIKLSNNIVVLSKEWLQLNSIVPSCRVFYLPNAIDTAYYRSIAEERISQGKINETCKILYLGYIGKDKGSFDLIDAISIIRSRGANIVLDLVGGELFPGEIDRLIMKIRLMNLESIINLHLPAYGAEKLALLKNADIFVYPSYHEGMPMAVIEAMACGLPIVATWVGGLPDLIHESKNGLLVEPEQPEQLADALMLLVKNKELQRAMQVANFNLTIEKYDIEQHVMQLIAIYKEILI